MLLGLAAEFLISCITLQVIECLPRVKVHLRLPVYSLVVNLGRLSGGIFLDFAAVAKEQAKNNQISCSKMLWTDLSPCI